MYEMFLEGAKLGVGFGVLMGVGVEIGRAFVRAALRAWWPTWSETPKLVVVTEGGAAAAVDAIVDAARAEAGR